MGPAVLTVMARVPGRVQCPVETFSRHMGALGWWGRWWDSVVTPCPADLLLDSPVPQGCVRRGRGTSTAVWNSSGLSRGWERMSAYGAWPPRLPPGLSLAHGALRDAQCGEPVWNREKSVEA